MKLVVLLFSIFMITFYCNAQVNLGTTRLSSPPLSDSLKIQYVKPQQKEVLLNNPKIHQIVKDCLKDSNYIVDTERLLNGKNNNYGRVYPIGDITCSGLCDSVIVIPELIEISKGNDESELSDGCSITFTNPKIPKIFMENACVQPENIFKVADIDEDGMCEIGEYWSSCASRYKTLFLISLQNGSWVRIAGVTYDIEFPNPQIEKRIKKISKNKFKMREISDLNKIRDKWVEFKMPDKDN